MIDVHPKCRKTASVLINILIVNEDFYNAEFGRVTYEQPWFKKNRFDQLNSQWQQRQLNISAHLAGLPNAFGE
jgi:hypothetical protein